MQDVCLKPVLPKAEKMYRDYIKRIRGGIMKKLIQASCCNDSIASDKNFYVTMPSECPNCKSAWSPIVLHGNYLDQEQYYRLDVMLLCPKCELSSLAIYFEKMNLDFCDKEGQKLQLMKVFPNTPKSEKFSDEITALSPNFVKIYNEALSAESYNLMELAGVGYRKAIEFLVKDYAISKNPKQKDVIVEKALGKCIEEYLKDTEIHRLIKSAVWIGNDQTHYKNKHEGIGIEELKILLKASVNNIDLMINSEKYASAILESKK